MRPLSSSKMTFFYKRVFPVIFFGFLLIFIVFGWSSASSGASAIPFLLVPLVMGIFGYRFMQKMAFNLVDEVLDAGNVLIVRSGGKEERIALSDIKNINYWPYMSPPQVTLSLRRHTVFGDTVVFCAPVSIIPLWSSPTIQDLIERVDAARRKQ
jgi:hypothetical protein